MGEIQSLEEGEVTVKYLLRCSQNVYQWSEGNKQEYSTESMKMIVLKVLTRLSTVSVDSVHLKFV